MTVDPLISINKDVRQTHITPGTFTYRRATPADAEAMLDLYEHLSSESRYTRFFRPLRRIDASMRAQILDLSAANVWLAFDGEVCVGEARVVRSTRDPCADLAVTIADDYQGHGLGSHLASLAVNDPAHENGCVAMSMLATNDAARRLARHFGVRLHFSDGILEGVIDGSSVL